MGQNRSLQLLRHLSSPLRRAVPEPRRQPPHCCHSSSRFAAGHSGNRAPGAVSIFLQRCGARIRRDRFAARRDPANEGASERRGSDGERRTESAVTRRRGLRGIAKWGRHRCRPHSHRCVVPPKRALGIRRFPRCAPKRAIGSVAGARTGIREHPPVIPRGRSGANPFAGHARKRSTGISATGLSLWPAPLGPRFGSRILPDTSRASDRSARSAATRLCAYPSSTAEPADKSPCTRQSRDRRGQTSPRLSGSNLSSDLRSLDRRSPGISAPFRWIETAPAMPTPQALRARLIHCRPISLWTRVDNSTLRRKSRCSAQGCETILPSSSAIPRCDRVAPAA